MFPNLNPKKSNIQKPKIIWILKKIKNVVSLTPSPLTKIKFMGLDQNIKLGKPNPDLKANNKANSYPKESQQFFSL